VYRLLGLSQRPAATLRPGLYRLYLEVGRVDVLDIPGQHAAEVAQAASRLMTLYFDRVLPHRTYYVSALKDPPELLMELLLRRGGPQ